VDLKTDFAMSRPIVLAGCILGSSDSWGLNRTHFCGIHVQAVEPSTTLEADITCSIYLNAEFAQQLARWSPLILLDLDRHLVQLPGEAEGGLEGMAHWRRGIPPDDQAIPGHCAVLPRHLDVLQLADRRAVD
jgi:hypothetical protein